MKSFKEYLAESEVISEAADTQLMNKLSQAFKASKPSNDQVVYETADKPFSTSFGNVKMRFSCVTYGSTATIMLGRLAADAKNLGSKGDVYSVHFVARHTGEAGCDDFIKTAEKTIRNLCPNLEYTVDRHFNGDALALVGAVDTSEEAILKKAAVPIGKSIQRAAKGGKIDPKALLSAFGR